MGQKPFFEPEHVQCLDAVGADPMRPPRLHDLLGHRLAITGGNSQLEGEFAGKRDAEQPGMDAAAKHHRTRRQERENCFRDILVDQLL
ncbi:hypothetical protein D9M72_634640 [compost metagenome]